MGQTTMTNHRANNNENRKHILTRARVSCSSPKNFLSGHVTHAVTITSSACAPVSGKYLQGFPRVFVSGKWRRCKQPQQKQHRSRHSHAGNHLADSNVCQWHGAVTRSSYEKKKKKGSWWCKIGGREGRIDGGESRSESQSPESLLSCRRHYLMKPRGGFSWGNVCVRREGEACWNRQRETRKELLQVCRGGEKVVANGGCVGTLSSSFEK